MSPPRLRLNTLSGRGDAPVLVLGPSLGTAAEVLWGEVASELRHQYRVMTWDLPGHAHAPAAIASFHVADIADAVHQAAQEHGVHRYAYAGVSFGGAVGLCLALRHPDDVLSLAVIASGGNLGSPQEWRERAQLVRERGVSAVVARSDARWFAPTTPRRGRKPREALLEGLRETDPESYAQCCLALADYDVRSELTRILAPTVVIWGAHDTVAPEMVAREVANGVPRGTAIRMQHVAHQPPFEDPVETAWLLREHLTGTLGGPVDSMRRRRHE